MWNSEFEDAGRMVRIIPIPANAKEGPVFIEVPEGTTFRQEVRWNHDHPILMASVPNDNRNMIKLRLSIYRLAEVPMDRDICGPFCIGTFYPDIGDMNLYVAFLDANVQD